MKKPPQGRSKVHDKRTKSATLGVRHHHRGVGEACVHAVSAIIRLRPKQAHIEGRLQIMSLLVRSQQITVSIHRSKLWIVRERMPGDIR